MVTTREWVLRRRMATQRLTSPGLPDAVDAVRLLTCVQAQEAPNALWSVGMRTRGATDDGIRAAYDAGAFLRTHILRPTWHFVAPEDLRWILGLTSPKVLSGMRGHFAKLGLDTEVAARGADVFRKILAGRTALTRREIAPHMRSAGLPDKGLPLGDLHLMNELMGVIVNGPMKGAQHTYLLVDEILPPEPELERDEALGALVHRFFAGHGPASIKDLTRWAAVTQADVRRGLDIVGDALESVEVDGTTLWFDPSVPARTAPDAPRAHLLPTYDEATLTYPALGFPVADGHPRGPEADPWIDPYASTVVVDGLNAGTWKRAPGRGVARIELKLASSLTAEQTAAVETATDRLATFLGAPREAFDPRRVEASGKNLGKNSGRGVDPGTRRS
ncbi:winged helix DNA-binding domain-containing protein [Occultella glacieicola]|uniref:Winged helix DNA-binding domain-containing protein n=1 Tax=Occultella glacieicola TaxID=2518684 RepID=A0ABY2E911_9MICO|nr:winged helix DNA-binding domain-containing protein [Occultella glacieicola]TDE98972.1 winged helix DNA-binding domain-containing protein [Occultella glacieicola]